MGREFMHIFDEWAESYDDAVYGKDEQYREVFENYEEILQRVAGLAKGTTIEFGVGTGNLFEKLVIKNLNVIGIEPNSQMRSIANQRFPNHEILDGDFIHFRHIEALQTIVSTYAFHHLTDEEKAKAAKLYNEILPSNGQVVFADTMFESEAAYKAMIEKSEKRGFLDLAEDLQREYYTTLPIMKNIFESVGFQISFEQLNDFVWLIHAKKQ